MGAGTLRGEEGDGLGRGHSTCDNPGPWGSERPCWCGRGSAPCGRGLLSPRPRGAGCALGVPGCVSCGSETCRSASEAFRGAGRFP